jgi:anti-anti-sigma regulatory factor
MAEVRVHDHGGGEIVVLLVGDIDDSIQARLDKAIDEVDMLERVNQFDRAIVDLRDVTLLSPAGVRFLRALHERGAVHGYDVDLSTLSGPAHAALEQAGFPLGIGEMPGASEPRGPSGEADQRTR